MQDERHRRGGQTSRDAGGRACVVAKRRAPARAKPGQPLAHRPHRHRERRRDLRRGLARDDAGDDLFSTVNSQAGILMRVVHLSGSLAGVWRLQPNPVPGEHS